jgi:hypothetical protein
MNKIGTFLLILALASSACSEVITSNTAELRSGPESAERYNVQFTDNKLASITKFENVSAEEESLFRDMALILQNKMAKDYPQGEMKRDAHPKNLACLQGEFIIEPNIPMELKVGLFQFPETYPVWIRISSSSGKIQSDKIKDVRGFAIKIMGVKGERFQPQNEEKETQDFILMSYPVMPLGTVKLFHAAVRDSIEWSPVVFFFRLILTGNFHILNELRKARQNQTSPLDIRYWSTTPYLFGTDQSVKYSLVPTSHLKSSLPSVLGDHYLTENMEKHLAVSEAAFDFMVQVRKDPVRMPVEDAGVEWSEEESPFIKVATLRIPVQGFRTKEREELAENLSFSPAHSLADHRPIGGINRARVEIYRRLSEFRHKHNNKLLIEPDNLPIKEK